MCYSDDPIRDFLRHEAKRERELEKFPECSECGEKITDEYLYEINDELICEECLNRYHRRSVDDYI